MSSSPATMKGGAVWDRRQPDGAVDRNQHERKGWRRRSVAARLDTRAAAGWSQHVLAANAHLLTNSQRPMKLEIGDRPGAIWRTRRRASLSKDFDVNQDSLRENTTVLDDGLGLMRQEVLSDPETRESYEDLVRRHAVVDALASARQTAGLKQGDVARAMGTTQSAISELEGGRAEPRLRTLQRYSRALGLRLDLSVMDRRLPVSTEASSLQLWRTIERKALSPLLTALATEKRKNRNLRDLAEAIDFDEPQVAFLLGSLQRRGWVNSDDSDGETVYSLGDRAAYVIGISLESSAVVGVLMDLHARVVHVRRVDLDDTAPSTVLGAAWSAVDQLYALREKHSVIGVGVSVAGVVTADTGTIRFAPDLRTDEWSWENVNFEGDLQALLQDRLDNRDLRVVVDNDANALAVYQYLRHASAREDTSQGGSCIAVVLMTGAGIGSGFVFHGHVMYGANSAAGEGGHSIVDPNGVECRAKLGHAGCLEAVASVQTMLERLDIKADTPSDVQRGYIELGRLAQLNDGLAAGALRDSGAALGRFIAGLIATNDPGRVVIYADEYLADDANRAAQLFQGAVEHGVDSASSKDDRVERKTALSWKRLRSDTHAVAAGSAVTRKFLYKPHHWAPSILDPDLTSGLAAGT